MQGLELARAYYEEYGAPMLHEQFPEWEGLIAVGLCGSGSECLGYDDEVSQDHDFEAGFCLFLPGEDVIDRQTAFRLERAYAKLPKEFRGFKKSLLSPAGGSRHGLVRMSEFFQAKLGNPEGKLSVIDWIRIPEYSILEAVNGEVWRDDSGVFTARRMALRTMPEDIRLKKLAGELATMAQAGQYNYLRCLDHGEEGAAQLAAISYAQAAIHAVFLLNRKLLPYYKWQFRALRDLPKLPELEAPLYRLISSGSDAGEMMDKYMTIENIASAIISELQDQGITEAVCGDLSKHASSVNDHIADPGLRNEDIFFAV